MNKTKLNQHCNSTHCLLYIILIALWIQSHYVMIFHNIPILFLSGEVKTLMVQLLRGVAHMHDNWIIHRDLKTSNLLLSHKGILKVMWSM